MKIIPSAFPGVLILEAEKFVDHRGFFMETYRKSHFIEANIDEDFVQENHSGSRRGTLRGLHYQIHQSQARLFWVTSGEVFDVIVDIRRSSPTFGKFASHILSAENRRQIFLPHGFAHGIYVLSDWAEIIYKVSDYYSPLWERSLLWNDPQLGIPWPLIDGQAPILSFKDQQGKPLKDADLFD